jgi:hypothetical protein
MKSNNEPEKEFACELFAMNTNDRHRYRKLRLSLSRAKLSLHAILNGVILELDLRRISAEDLLDWVRLEHQCCPWISISFEHSLPQRLMLQLTAPSEAQGVLRAEFADLFD